MKNLSLFVSSLALCASTSYAAIDCGTLPSCDSLGYSDKVTDCPSSSEVLKCPFDTAKGKCQRGPSVGDLKYSLNTGNHNGWILCNGQSIDKTQYAALYSIIGVNYGGTGNNFNVPDYRGFFLRAAGTASVNTPLSSFGGTANNSFTTPQKEQLPNITGTIPSDAPSNWHKYNEGCFYGANGQVGVGGITTCGEANAADRRYYLGFNAAASNPVYTTGGHVIPANYAANIFIYAGR